jgi:hypothetical protein
MYGEKSPGRAEDIFLYQGTNLGDFSPKKANFWTLMKNAQGLF